MLGYAVQRLLMTVPVMGVVALIVFSLLYLTPGDPAQVLAGDTAVLEFETTVDDKYVNGVDIIRINDQGKIVEFRVMIRPLQAVNAVHAQMRSMLQKLSEPGTSH